MRRIQKELSILGYASRLKQPVSDKKRERYYPLQDDFSHWGRITQVGDDDSHSTTTWTVLMRGPAGSPFEGAVFKLRVEFPPTYPFKSPQFQFIADAEASIPFHPLVFDDGTMCEPFWCGMKEWSPMLGGQAAQGGATLFCLKNIRGMLNDLSRSFNSSVKTTYGAYLSACGVSQQTFGKCRCASCLVVRLRATDGIHTFTEASRHGGDEALAALAALTARIKTECAASFTPAANAAFESILLPFPIEPSDAMLRIMRAEWKKWSRSRWERTIGLGAMRGEEEVTLLNRILNKSNVRLFVWQFVGVEKPVVRRVEARRVLCSSGDGGGGGGEAAGEAAAAAVPGEPELDNAMLFAAIVSSELPSLSERFGELYPIGLLRHALERTRQQVGAGRVPRVDAELAANWLLESGGDYLQTHLELCRVEPKT